MNKLLITFITTFLMCSVAFAQTNVIEPELQEVLNEKGDEMIRVNIILKS